MLLLIPTGTKGAVNSNFHANNLTLFYDSVKVYIDNGLYQEAIHCLDKIILIKQKFEIDSFPEYSKVYNRYGMIYKKMGMHEKAVHYYEKTLEYPLSPKNKAYVLTNIGNVFTLKADFNSAITYYNKVLSIISDLKENEPALIADTYYNIGKAYDNTSQNKLALKYFLLSEMTRDEARLPGDGDTYFNCATNYNKLGEKDTANIYFNKAIKCFEKEYGKNHYSTALAYMNYANFLSNNQKNIEALKLYNISLRILENSVGNKHLYTSFCYKNEGKYYLEQKDYKKALIFFQKSLIAKVYDFNDTSIYSNPVSKAFSNIDILDVLTYKALAFEKLANKEDKETNLFAAFKTLELKIELIEQLRTGYLSENAKLRLSENEDDTYLVLIRMTDKLYCKTKLEKYAEAAFRYSEKGKYSVLREFYNEEALMKSASVPDSLYEKQKKIREKLGESRWQIDNENSQATPDKNKISELEEQLFSKTQELESLSKELVKKYPKYVKLKYSNEVVDIKTLQSRLRNNQVAFEYAISDSTLYTFFISKGKFDMKHKKLEKQFYQNLDFYKSFLNSFDWLSYDSFRISAYYLYQTLIQPFEKEIKDKSLLIIPDNNFALISFESLVDEPYKKVEIAHYAYEPYIIRKYPIGYAFSASFYLESLKKTNKKGNRILAFAPNYKISKDSSVVLPDVTKYLRRLTFINGKYYSKIDATETNFKKKVSDFDIIHLYTHGYEDINNPSNSSLVFSNENDPENDGYLYAHEISNLPINAKLVVLASCYSGSGKISEGEGILSIGRSFISAGTPSIILSLWYTYWETSTEQLGSFHKYLLLGKRKDKALQLAKLEYLKNANPLTAHPKKWASLVIAGNQEPLYHYFIIKALIFTMFSFVALFFVIKMGVRFIKGKKI